MSDLKIVAEPGRQDIVITRTFDAPREKVFAAMTDPESIARWWGLAETDTRVETAQVRSGGRWRFVETAPDGQEYGFHGVYHEVVAPERHVQTFEYEGTPGHVSLETHTLEEDGERTFYTCAAVFQSVQDRDAMIAAGMETGLSQSLEALEGLVAVRA